MPEKTLEAFADHGNLGRVMHENLDDAERLLAHADQAGLDLRQITTGLERDGVRTFRGSYHELLACIESKLRTLSPADPTATI